ncbi:MAG TPA: hydrogenase maturation protease [Terriglobales bacterium]|nr:hydrogenase maturation protease [Terriglobales bacterium]
MKGKILVACVGNVSLGDDAFGVELGNRLARVSLPDHVVVREFGAGSQDVVNALVGDWQLVVLVRALQQGERPGTVSIFEPEVPKGVQPAAPFDSRRADAGDILAEVTGLGGKVARMIVVACEPARLDPSATGCIRLSTPAQAALNEAQELVLRLVSTTAVAKAA